MSALQSRINESIEQKPEVNARNKAIQVSLMSHAAPNIRADLQPNRTVCTKI